MKIYCNEAGEIHDVYQNNTGEELTEYEVTDGTFDGWSKGKILCYKCHVTDGNVDMLTPCVDSRIIRNFDNTQAVTINKTAYIGDTEVIFSDVPEGNISVYVKASDGTYPSYRVERVEDVVIVSFDELETTATITISII